MDSLLELAGEGAADIREACQFLGIRKSKLYQEMAAGRLPYLRIGDRRLIPRVALRRYLAQRLAETLSR